MQKSNKSIGDIMKECLDYIKETGKEIKELNEKIQTEMSENKQLREKIRQLEMKVKDKEKELESAWDLANTWYRDYESLSSKYDNLEAKNDFISMAFAKLAPKLNKAMEEDYDEGEFFSEIIRECKRSRW